MEKKVKQVFLSPPHMGCCEQDYVDLAFRENYIAPVGSNLSAFETDIAALSGRKFAVALSSGTAGIHLALKALGVMDTDRVYVSDTTFVGSVNPVLYERATPVFIDCEPGSWNMSPIGLERALTSDAKSGSLPKAIIVVHLYGQSAQLEPILELAQAYGVPIIEDAAESLGASYEGLPSGKHGVIGVYSFNGNKIVTTSGGGALVTDESYIAERVRKLSTQSRDPADHYEHSEIGFNYRMSNVLAGIGRGQLQVLEKRVHARRKVFDTYVSELEAAPQIQFQTEWPNSRGNRWLTVIKFDGPSGGKLPVKVMKALNNNGIEARPGWKPMHMQPLFQNSKLWRHSEDAVIGPDIFARTLCLPSGSSLKEAEQLRVVNIVKDVVNSRL